MEKQNNTSNKLTDKAFSRLVLTSILGIVVCIVCLCSTSYAWFVDSVPSEKNEIKTSSECLLEVSVLRDGALISGIENGVELEAGVEYTVILLLPPDTGSGYCMITAGGNTYYSDYIVRHSDAVPQTVTFKLKVENTQTVTFTTRWGIYTRDSDVVNGELLIP